MLLRGGRRDEELEGAEGLVMDGEGVEFVGVAVFEPATAGWLSIEDIVDKLNKLFQMVSSLKNVYIPCTVM